MSAELLARLHELFEYDRENGRLIFKVSRGSKAVGSIAGSLGNDGYIRVKVDSVDYKMHQIIWLLETGKLVPNIDHWNGDTTNNRFSNLRESTYQQNIANAKLPSHNTSGHRGISWVAYRNKYLARIKVSRKVIFLGYHDTFDQAVQAYRSAAEKYFGEFAYHKRQS